MKDVSLRHIGAHICDPVDGGDPISLPPEFSECGLRIVNETWHEHHDVRVRGREVVAENALQLAERAQSLGEGRVSASSDHRAPRQVDQGGVEDVRQPQPIPGTETDFDRIFVPIGWASQRRRREELLRKLWRGRREELLLQLLRGRSEHPLRRLWRGRTEVLLLQLRRGPSGELLLQLRSRRREVLLLRRWPSGELLLRQLLWQPLWPWFGERQPRSSGRPRSDRRSRL